MSLYRDHSHQRAKILATQTTSEVIKTPAHVLFGLKVPVGFTGTSLTFLVSETAVGDFQPLYDDTGNRVSLTVAAGRSYSLPAALACWPYFQIVSNAPETAERLLVIVAKG